MQEKKRAENPNKQRFYAEVCDTYIRVLRKYGSIAPFILRSKIYQEVAEEMKLSPSRTKGIILEHIRDNEIRFDIVETNG